MTTETATSPACAVCGRPFVPNPAMGARQITCGDPACQVTHNLRRNDDLTLVRRAFGGRP